VRILYHHRTRGRHVEGVHIRGIVHALRELGHEVTVLSFPGADPEDEEKSEGAAGSKGRLATLVTRAPGVLFEFLELAYNLVTLVRVGAAIRRLQPQLIYERYSLFLCATIWLARRRGIPIILEINDSALVRRVRPLTMKHVAQRIESWCLRNCSGLVFISGYFRDRAVAAYGAIAPSVISPNAADIKRFDTARFDKIALRRQRGIGDQVVCGYVGAFIRWHGVAEFVERIADRLAAVPQLTLLLVGDGADLAAIRTLIESRGLGDRVLLPGRVAHGDIPAWIACMDYAVLPDSNEYGSPMKLFEFMAMGVGVVSPDYAPITEVVTDGRTGWLVAHGRIDACVERVLALAAHRDEQARVGAAARDYIARERQWRNNAEQLLSLLPASTARGD